jgi:hypothetical protein
MAISFARTSAVPILDRVDLTAHELSRCLFGMREEIRSVSVQVEEPSPSMEE